MLNDSPKISKRSGLSKLAGAIRRSLHKAKKKDSYIDELILTPKVVAFGSAWEKALNRQIGKLPDTVIEQAVNQLSKVSANDLKKVRAVIEAEWGSIDEFIKKNDVTAFQIGVFNASANHVLDKLGIEGVFGLYNPTVIAALNDRTNYLIKSVDDTTLDSLAKIIADGAGQGLSWEEIAGNIRGNYPEIARYRSELIARMETANGVNTAELTFYQKNGLNKKTWVLASSHSHTDICDDCADEGELELNETFASGDLAPPAHVNCMCTINTVVPDDFIENGPSWLGD